MNIAVLLVLATIAVALVVPLVLGIWRLPIRSMVPSALIPTVERVQSRAKPVVVGVGSFAGRLAIGLIVLAREGLTGLGGLTRRGSGRGFRAVRTRLAWAALGTLVFLSTLWTIFLALLIALVTLVEFTTIHSGAIAFRTTIRLFTAGGRIRNGLSAGASSAAVGAGRISRQTSSGAGTLTRRVSSGASSIASGISSSATSVASGISSGATSVASGLSAGATTVATRTRRLGSRARRARTRWSESRWNEETVSIPRSMIAKQLPDKRFASARLLLAVVISASAFAVAIILAFRWLGAAIRSIVS
jgi:hypothetical protein